MPPPILDLTPQWSITQKTRIAANVINLGDGYNILAQIGTGAIDETWAVQSPAIHYGNALQVMQELTALTGTEKFEWSPDGVDRRLYVCDRWQLVPAGPGYYRISGDFASLGEVVFTDAAVPNPILPIILTWNTAYTYTARTDVNQTRFRDGVDRRAAFMINPITEAIEAQVLVKNYGDIHSFLRERRGRSFRLPPENHHLQASPDNLYICKEWSFQKSGYGIVWRFSGRFEQVRTLQNAPA